MFVKVELDVNIDDVIDTTDMSEGQIKKIAKVLAEHILDRYLAPEYFSPEDISDIISE